MAPDARAHLLVEAMRRAYADRARLLGDPAFVKVPVRGLLDPRYAARLRAGISLERATPSRVVSAGDPWPYDKPSTAHCSTVDAAGSAVALTQSVNYYFGSGVMVPDTGVLLNDTMDDFAIAPGVATVFGLTG